jgi:capsule polysaccharide export protein KpsC/LpsZ
MTAPPQFLFRQVNIHPREADVIAGEIQRLIQRLAAEHSDLDTTFINGVYGWLGHQKDQFWEQARPRIKKLADFIELLKTRESYYRSLMVWTWEEYPNPEWNPREMSKQ